MASTVTVAFDTKGQKMDQPLVAMPVNDTFQSFGPALTESFGDVGNGWFVFHSDAVPEGTMFLSIGPMGSYDVMPQPVVVVAVPSL